MAGYLDHFGLKIAPFSASPDPQFAYATREHQLAVAKIQYAVEERQGLFLLQGEIGTGKCLGVDTPVLMYDGSVRPVQRIKPGDVLMGPDSLPRIVLSTTRGTDRLYRIIPAKGDAYVVNEPHILSLKMTTGCRGKLRDRSGEVINISVKDYLSESPSFKSAAKGWRTAVEFPFPQPLRLEPYYVGIWLGDGCSASPRIATTDVPVVDYLEEFAERTGGVKVRRVSIKGDKCPLYDLTTGRACGPDGSYLDRNPILTALRSYGLIGNKHIPKPFKTNTEQHRLQLLAGLVDSDGSLSDNGYELVFKQRRLAEDTLFLARSLGLAAYSKECVKRCSTTGAEGVYHRIFISGDVDRIPVKIPRKQAAPRRQKKDVLLTGIRVEEAGEGRYYGFEISGDGLFLLGDFTVTHNTTISQFMLNAWRDDKSLAVAHITNPAVRTPSQFLRLILSHYGIPPPHLLQDNWDALRSLLVGNYREEKTTVLVIDEAQTISAENLETLTHISNEQTQKAKLIQIVLLAQPNIIRKLTYKPALRDRIAHGSTLNPLSFGDAVEMLRHRVRKAGGDFDALFPADLSHAIYNNTKGVPRRLCMLCDNMLLNAYALKKPHADAEDLAGALQDLAFKGWKDT